MGNVMSARESVCFGSEYEIPDAVWHLVDLGEAIELSEGNDACPSFGKHIGPRTTLRIWVESVDPARRESPDSERRLCVSRGPKTLLRTDDAEQAVAAYRAAMVRRRA